MTCEDNRVPSPLIAIYDGLRAFQPKWHVKFGIPSGRGWIASAQQLGPFTSYCLVSEREHTRPTVRRSLPPSPYGMAGRPVSLLPCI